MHEEEQFRMPRKSYSGTRLQWSFKGSRVSQHLVPAKLDMSHSVRRMFQLSLQETNWFQFSSLDI